MYNASERKQVRAAEKAAKLAEQQRHEILGGIMSVAPGRAWIYDRLASCGIWVSTFVPDPYVSAFNEGRRSAGLELLNDISIACPKFLTVMMEEANVRASANRSSGNRTDFNGGDSGPRETSAHDTWDGGEGDEDGDDYRA